MTGRPRRSTPFPHPTPFRPAHGSIHSQNTARKRAVTEAAAVFHFHLKRAQPVAAVGHAGGREDRKSTRLNSSHANISYAVFCLKKKKKKLTRIENGACDHAG